MVGELLQRFEDADADGFGVAGSEVQRCFEAEGWVASNTDCDDDDAAISPAEEDRCGNGTDDDCEANGVDCGLTGEVDLEAGLLSHVIEGDSRTAGLHFGSEVQFVDVDSDGTLEIAVNTRGPDRTVLVLQNIDQPGHTQEEDHRILLNSGGSGELGRMSFGDLDGDGHLDVLYRSDLSPGGLTPLGPYLAGWLAFGPLDTPTSLTDDANYVMFPGAGAKVVADLTGDGMPDIVDSEGTNLFITSASRTELLPVWCDAESCTSLDLGGPWWGVGGGQSPIRFVNHIVADVTGDGAADLVGWNPAEAQVVVFQGPLQPSDGFLPEATLLGPSAAPLSGVELIGDLDGDGDPEVRLHADELGDTVWIARLQDLVGQGDREIDPLWTLTNVPSGSTAKVIASPWEQDATSILVQTQGLAWLVDSPEPGSIDVQTQATLTLTLPGEAFVAGTLDVDEDGLPNLIVSHPGYGLNSGRIFVLFPSEE